MPTMAEVEQQVWRSVVPGLAFNPDAAIVKKWRALRKAGTPVGVPVTDALDIGNGQVAQGFSSGNVLVWVGGENVEVH